MIPRDHAEKAFPHIFFSFSFSFAICFLILSSLFWIAASSGATTWAAFKSDRALSQSFLASYAVARRNKAFAFESSIAKASLQLRMTYE